MIDTQGMTIKRDEISNIQYSTDNSSKESEYKFKKLRVFSDLEREEIKGIIHEALDEREKRWENADDSWLYRGTY